MAEPIRGADALVRALQAAGTRTLFTLSGNHIMPVYDALLGTGIDLVHTRHEAAAVHMADAWAPADRARSASRWSPAGRGTPTPSPRCPPRWRARCRCCCSRAMRRWPNSASAPSRNCDRPRWRRPSARRPGRRSRRPGWRRTSRAPSASRRSGRPGPVHLSLPTDVLEARIDAAAIAWPAAAAFAPAPMPLPARMAAAVVAEHRARRSARCCSRRPRSARRTGARRWPRCAAALGVPVMPMESPRGINDPSLGAFAEVLAEADLIVLLGKPLDFTLRFGRAPAVRRRALDRARPRRRRCWPARSACSASGWCCRPSAARPRPPRRWPRRRRAAPPAGRLGRRGRGRHRASPRRLGRRIRAAAPTRSIRRRSAPRCDPSWRARPMPCWSATAARSGNGASRCWQRRRALINGVAGAIGAALPFALAARAARGPKPPVLALMGDGTFGFHMAEFDTACRHGLPFVCVVGNDAKWNAEHQIQLREYGAQRDPWLRAGARHALRPGRHGAGRAWRVRRARGGRCRRRSSAPSPAAGPPASTC